MEKFRKSVKHKGLVSSRCSKSASGEGLFAALDLRSLKMLQNVICNQKSFKISKINGIEKHGFGVYLRQIHPRGVPNLLPVHRSFTPDNTLFQAPDNSLDEAVRRACSPEHPRE